MKSIQLLFLCKVGNLLLITLQVKDLFLKFNYYYTEHVIANRISIDEDIQ